MPRRAALPTSAGNDEIDGRVAEDSQLEGDQRGERFAVCLRFTDDAGQPRELIKIECISGKTTGFRARWGSALAARALSCAEKSWGACGSHCNSE